MVLAMLAGMAVGMVIHLVLSFLMSPLLGMFETMIPASVTGMYGGMFFGMRDSMAAGSPTLSGVDRKSTRLNSSHLGISYAVFCFSSLAGTSSLSLHDALPIYGAGDARRHGGRHGDPSRAELPDVAAARDVRDHDPGVGHGDVRRHVLRHARLHGRGIADAQRRRSEEHTSELQSLRHLVCRLLLLLPSRHVLSFPTRRSSDLWCWRCSPAWRSAW